MLFDPTVPSLRQARRLVVWVAPDASPATFSTGGKGRCRMVAAWEARQFAFGDARPPRSLPGVICQTRSVGGRILCRGSARRSLARLHSMFSDSFCPALAAPNFPPSPQQIRHFCANQCPACSPNQPVPIVSLPRLLLNCFPRGGSAGREHHIAHEPADRGIGAQRPGCSSSPILRRPEAPGWVPERAAVLPAPVATVPIGRRPAQERE
jgi:hypothetical protein